MGLCIYICFNKVTNSIYKNDFKVLKTKSFQLKVFPIGSLLPHSVTLSLINIVRIEFSPLVEIDVNKGHYYPEETTDEGPTPVDAETGTS